MYGDNNSGTGTEELNDAFSQRQQLALKIRRLIDTLSAARMPQTHEAVRNYELQLLQDAYIALSRPAYKPTQKLPLEEVMGFTK